MGVLQVKRHEVIAKDPSQGRTLLASQRTLLAYIRTSLAFLVAGFTLIKLFDATVIDWVGGAMVPIGVGIGAFGIVRYQRTKHRVVDEVERNGPVEAVAEVERNGSNNEQ